MLPVMSRLILVCQFSKLLFYSQNEKTGINCSQVDLEESWSPNVLLLDE